LFDINARRAKTPHPIHPLTALAEKINRRRARWSGVWLDCRLSGLKIATHGFANHQLNRTSFASN
jgi:hypothetical protein